MGRSLQLAGRAPNQKVAAGEDAAARLVAGRDSVEVLQPVGCPLRGPSPGELPSRSALNRGMLRGGLSARPSFVCWLAAATGHRSGTHSVPTKIRAIRGPAAYRLAGQWPFSLVRGHARRVPPADEEPIGVVLAEEAGVLLGGRRRQRPSGAVPGPEPLPPAGGRTDGPRRRARGELPADRCTTGTTGPPGSFRARVRAAAAPHGAAPYAGCRRFSDSTVQRRSSCYILRPMVIDGNGGCPGGG